MKKLIINNNFWSIIPARSGSKKIKDKNLKKILNYSLVGCAIKASEKSKFISRIFVSTDSKKIKREALKLGAEVPFLRSKKNSGDLSTDFDVVSEFLRRIIDIEYILPEYIIYLRPTTPLRDPKVLDLAMMKFKKLKNYDSLASVQQMNEPVYKKFLIKNNKLQCIFPNQTLGDATKPRQNFPITYEHNGYLDIVRTKNVFKKKYLGVKCFPFILPRAIDIDDQFDLSFARYAAKYLYKFNKKNF